MDMEHIQMDISTECFCVCLKVFVLSAPEPGQSQMVGKFPEASNPFVRDLIARLTTTQSTSSRAARSVAMVTNHADTCTRYSLMHHCSMQLCICNQLHSSSCLCCWQSPGPPIFDLCSASPQKHDMPHRACHVREDFQCPDQMWVSRLCLQDR